MPRRCPSCGDDFIDTASRCPSCLVDLIDADTPVSYSFLTDDADAVEALERLLRESAISYELHDDELSVPGTSADAVERVLDHLDRVLGIAVAHGDAVETFELWDWEDDELDRLEAELRRARVPHQWHETDGFLLVPPSSLEAAEAVLDLIEHPDALAISDANASDVDPRLMGDLYLAVERVRREPRDVVALGRLRDHVRQVDAGAAPFGVDPATWRGAVEAAQRAVAAGLTEPPDDDTVTDSAGKASALLRPLV